MLAFTNPFDGIIIGSTVDVNGAFHESVVAHTAQITRINPQYYQQKTMRGNSSLVYTEDMNQASLSVAGAYGVSGVQKLTAAATGYCGRSTGENAKTTSVVLEVLIRAGFETVLLNNMSPPELLEALALGPRHSAKKALDASNALMTKLRATKTGLLETLSKPEARNGKTISKLYGEWLQAADQFRANYGEGVIVGIVWGGIGRSELTIRDVATAVSWKYGGAAEFTYASNPASVSLGATYDGSSASNRSNVTVSCESHTWGTCAKEYTDAWDRTLADKAFDAIADKPLLKLPDLNGTATLPKVPDFIEPKADEETEKKAENVKAEDLDQLAKAAAYDQLKAAYEKLRKPGDPEFDIRLADFLAMAALKPPDDKMIEFRKKVRENAFSTLSLLEPPDDKVVESRKKVRGNAFSTLSARDQPSPRLPAVAVSAARTPMSVRALAAEQPDTNSCVPIGVWISNWADLFPWLATGHLNGIDQTAEAENAVKFRMMQQDFLTLSRLYYTAANASLDLRTEPNSQPQDFLQIADSFARQYATLSSGEVEPEEYGEKAVEAVGQLGMPESGIYQMWDRIQFLRNAELGLGVLVDGQSSGLIPATNLNFDFGEGWGEAGKEWTRALADFGLRVQKAACSFRPSSQNHAAFARFYKLIPLILPSSKKIVALGPGGLLCKAFATRYENVPVHEPGIELDLASRIGAMFSLLCAKAFDSSALTFSRFAGPVERIVDRGSPSQNIRLPFEVKPIEFVPGPDDNGSLVSVGGGVPGNPAFEGEVVLHPVPFSAAKGVSLWSGQSVSTNVGADEKLDEKLQKLTADLRRPGMTNWSFSSQRLPKAGWTAASPYQPTNVRPQYFGLLPEPSAVF